jgi:hypothetical protein
VTDATLPMHAARLMDNISVQWLLQFTIATDEEVFPDHDEQIIYTARKDAPIVHMVRFHKTEAARWAYRRVLSLGATEVRTARRLMAYSDWEDATP